VLGGVGGSATVVVVARPVATAVVETMRSWARRIVSTTAVAMASLHPGWHGCICPRCDLVRAAIQDPSTEVR
jgi:hypothetical protein